MLDRVGAMRTRMKADQVPLLSAAVAFWAMLALVPALVALVSLYGLVANPADVERQVREHTEALPEEAQQLVVSQLAAVVDSPGAGLGTGLVLGIAFALFAASAAMRTLTTAVGVVYGDVPGSRSYARERGRALALTLGAVGFVAAAVYVVTIVPTGHPLLWLLDWVLLGGGLLLGIGALYRLGPARHPESRLVTAGSVTAAVLTVAVSLLFTLYASTFGTYNETYGSLAAVVVLLLWFQLSAMTVLVGATLNQILLRS
jgi:membrane protein